jgi:F0F1-type ATP synthase assembly protein I
MEPIISPWIVYGIGVINKLSIVTFITMVISITGMLILAMNDSTYGNGEQEKRILKILAIIVLVATVLLVILPTKDTMLTMLTLQYVTPDNVQAVQGNVADFVNQIAQAVKNAK